MRTPQNSRGWLVPLPLDVGVWRRSRERRRHPARRRGRGGAERLRLPALPLLPPGRPRELQHVPQRPAVLPGRPHPPPDPAGQWGRGQGHPGGCFCGVGTAPSAWSIRASRRESSVPSPAEFPRSHPALAEVSLRLVGVRRGWLGTPVSLELGVGCWALAPSGWEYGSGRFSLGKANSLEAKASAQKRPAGGTLTARGKMGMGARPNRP